MITGIMLSGAEEYPFFDSIFCPIAEQLPETVPRKRGKSSQSQLFYCDNNNVLTLICGRAIVWSMVERTSRRGRCRYRCALF